MSPDDSRPSRWWIAPVLGVVVIVTAALALVAHNLYQRPVPKTLPSVVVESGSVTLPSSAEPGSPTVTETLDVQRDSTDVDVRRILQTYFDGINTKQYSQWRSVVTSDLASQEPDQQVFDRDYASTKDGSIVVDRVDTTPDGSLRVLFTFHSTQSLQDAPKSFPHTCIVWHVVLPLVQDSGDGSWRLDAGSTPQQAQC